MSPPAREGCRVREGSDRGRWQRGGTACWRPEAKQGVPNGASARQCAKEVTCHRRDGRMGVSGGVGWAMCGG